MDDKVGRWRYRTRSGANAGWTRWLEDARTCSLAPVAKVARMIGRHLWGRINAVVLRATNGPAEGINSRIKTVNVRSRGFCNPGPFAGAILFHLGGLDLMPTGGSRPSR